MIVPVSIGAKDKMWRHIECLDIKLHSLTTNIKMTGHTRRGKRPAPARPSSLNDHMWRSLLDPHHRPPDPGGRDPRSLRYDPKVTS